MSLETANHISQLVASNPAPADPKSQGDDHIRGIKRTLLNDLQGFAGAILIAGADGGVTNAYMVTPANPLDIYSVRMTVVFSPVVPNTGAATMNISTLGPVPLRSVSGAELTNNDLVPGAIYAAMYTGSEFRLTGITKNYADQLSFVTTLPQQAGNAGKFVTTDGTNATWAPVIGNSLYLNANFGGY